MFYEWVTEGAAFGVKAFFGIVVFGLFCAACFGVLMLLGNAVKGGEPDGEKKRRSY